MSIHDNIFDLLDEALEPTGPIGSWKARIYIKDLLVEETLPPEAINKLGKHIAGKLERCSLFTGEQAEYIISNFEHVWDEETFNRILDEMYTECDILRILVE